MPRTHLFVAPGNAAFGELLLGLRLARELHAAGDRVVFLAPRSHRMLLEHTPFDHGAIDPVLPMLDRALPGVIRDRACDSVVLLDLLSTLLVLEKHRIEPAFLDELGVTTHALDIWDLARSDLLFDMCDAQMTLRESARTLVPRRLVPVPFARPDAAGAYCALPEITTADDRTATRAELGLATGDRLVMFTTAQFQSRGLTAFQTRAVAEIPARILDACLAADPRVHVAHVGPRALAQDSARYHHLPQMVPARFEQVMRASDLLLTPNQAATGISLALALDVPALAVIGESTQYKFRVFPLGLHAFMAPALDHNAYTDAVPAIDVAALAGALHAEIFDDATRTERQRTRRAYVDAIRRLPTGRAVMDRA